MFSANRQEGQTSPGMLGDKQKARVITGCKMILAYFTLIYSDNYSFNCNINYVLCFIYIFCVRIGLGLRGLGVYRQMVKRFLIRIASVSRGHHQAHVLTHALTSPPPNNYLSLFSIASTQPTRLRDQYLYSRTALHSALRSAARSLPPAFTAPPRTTPPPQCPPTSPTS